MTYMQMRAHLNLSVDSVAGWTAIPRHRIQQIEDGSEPDIYEQERLLELYGAPEDTSVRYIQLAKETLPGLGTKDTLATTALLKLRESIRRDRKAPDARAYHVVQAV